MVSLRDGKTVEIGSSKVDKASQSNKPSRITNQESTGTVKASLGTSKKRKSTSQDGEETSSPPTPKRQETPPPVKLESETKDNERTPGRNGPIKQRDFSVNPDIKPFKGPKGKKVRKTAQEKEQEYRKFGLENEGHVFHELYVCYDKGPNGSPTYDKSGFELDYQKVADWMRPRPYNKQAIIRGMDKALEKAESEEQRMAEIFFEKGEAPESSYGSYDHVDFWKDRVSKDLNVPWHKIGVKEFEEWEKRGFKKARKGEYENFSKAERDRMMRLHDGCKLRK